MPDVTVLSLAGAKSEAEDGQSRLANSVLHLFQAGFNPNSTTPLADFLTNEADFDGYTPKTIATWSTPILAGAGYVTYAPTQTFPWTHDTDDVGNQIGGWFLVLADGTLYMFALFDPTRPCQGPDQAIVTQPTDVYLAG